MRKVRGAVAGIEQHRLISAEKELLETTLKGSITLLTEILSLLNPVAFGRATMLKNSVKLVAKELKLEDNWELEIAPMLSQIGYLALPPEMVAKAYSGEALSKQESELFSNAPRIGSELLKNIPRLESIARIVLYQNKQYDGKGFPHDSVAGKEIPLGSRILKILNDLIQAESEGLTRNEAWAEMRERGGWYDPRLFDTSVSVCVTQMLSSSSEEIVHVEIPFEELAIGDVLLSNVECIDGRNLIARGSAISPVVLARLKNYQKVVKIKEPINVERIVPKNELE